MFMLYVNINLNVVVTTSRCAYDTQNVLTYPENGSIIVLQESLYSSPTTVSYFDYRGAPKQKQTS